MKSFSEVFSFFKLCRFDIFEGDWGFSFGGVFFLDFIIKLFGFFSWKPLQKWQEQLIFSHAIPDLSFADLWNDKFGDLDIFS